MPRRSVPRHLASPRTYLALAIGSASDAAFARALGTIAAPHRRLAREAARILYPQVAPDELRVVAAGGAPAGLLAAALAADGGLVLAGG
jgi:sarcosine oxidase gamma subunit